MYCSANAILKSSEGYSFNILSSISLNNYIAAYNAVPFSNDLVTQHGSQVLCLPYTISPLSLVKKLRSQQKRIVVNDDLQFDPAINLNFVSNVTQCTK